MLISINKLIRMGFGRRVGNRRVFGLYAFSTLALLLLMALAVPVPVYSQTLNIQFDSDTKIYAQGETANIAFSYSPNAPVLIEIRNSSSYPIFAWEDTTNSSGMFVLRLNMSFPPGQYTLYAKADQAQSTETFKISPPFISVLTPKALKADLSPTTVSTQIYYYFNGSTIHIETGVYAPNDHFTLMVNATSLGLGTTSYTSSNANESVFPYQDGKLYKFIINLTVPNNYLDTGGKEIDIIATGTGAQDLKTFIAVLNINPREDPMLGLSGSTTDFRTVTDFTDITNLTFEKFINNAAIGKIIFLESINLCDNTTVNALINLGNNLDVALAKMSLDTAADALAAMNKSSQLYMYNLPFVNPPGILKDGVPVVLSGQTSGGPVYDLSWNNDTKVLQFKVAHWTTYEAEGLPPTVTINSPQNTTYATPSVPINVSVVDPSGVSHVIAEVNGANNYTLVQSGGYYVNSSTITFNQGSNVVRIYANDTLNNIISTTVYFTVDSVPPTISSLSPADGSTVTTTTPTISASFSDNVAVDAASVIVKVDGVDVTSSSTVTQTGFTYTPAGLSEGSHTVYVSVKDTSNNQATKTWSFTVSIPAPPPPPPAPPPAPTPVSGTTASIILSIAANTPTSVDVGTQAP
ncbi:MAG: Ig-like domain-containing protein, partial [Candidatus Methanomethylicaceae archaeon]